MSGVGGYRLLTGGCVDRTRPLAFSFDGRSMQGYAGDTLASALIAEGVSVIARGLKYHRPRGFFGAGLEDPQSMLSVRDAHGYDPAIRAGQVRLASGMQVGTTTGIPSPRFDFGAVAQLFGPLLAAGFYYKTFKWPSWRWFEPAILRATGFGSPSGVSDRRTVQHRHATCDVLVIGAGPSGILTALGLQGTGLRIIVADDQPTPGGSLLWDSLQIEGSSPVEFARSSIVALEADSDITLLRSTIVTGAYENDFFTLVQSLHDDGGVRGERLWKLRARHVVLATGMIDRPLLFAGNDRPGVMLSSATRRLIGEFAVAPARRIAIHTNNDSGYLTAIQARRAGIDVAAVIDTRAETAALHLEETRSLGIACHMEAVIENTAGYRRLRGVTVRSSRGSSSHVECDGLAVSGGWTPLIHLAAHRGVKPAYDAAQRLFVCRDLPPRWRVVGGAAAALDAEGLARSVEQAVAAIAEKAGRKSPGLSARISGPSFGNTAPEVLPVRKSFSRTWVDLQNDVKLSDIELAATENYVSVEHLKRYTTLGMGTDQGRTSNVIGLTALASLTGREVSEVGTTTFRPPFSAIRLATIADARQGDLYRPRRYLPADAEHRKLGAVMEDFGWERPNWYRCNGETSEAAVAAEMRAVREGAGIFDGSSLGKLEVTGPDAARFLARFYVSDIKTLRQGRIRYSVMMRDDGVVFDDGIVACVSQNHFLASPTSGNADTVAAWFERWRQTEWPGDRVAISVVTSSWATFAIAGPFARVLLERLEPDFDVSGGAFPHMAFREGLVSGVRARVARVSFTGELQYELSVPARYAKSLMQSLLAAAGSIMPKPVGMEAWLRLRLEKGYIHVGSETNGRTTPIDLGMSREIAKRSDDFIGKRSLNLSFARSAQREQLVGLEAVEGIFRAGDRVLAGGRSAPPAPTDGYVTSACFSPVLNRYIGLALMQKGHSRFGEVIAVFGDGKTARCRVCKPQFHDPTDARLRA
jgi:sarcosine oxidase subunit alpha